MSTDSRSTSFASWSQSRLQRLEDFGHAWDEGLVPRIEDYLPEDYPGREREFREYLSRELDCRVRRKEAVSVEEYCRRFPGYDSLIRQVFWENRPPLPARFEITNELGRGGFGVVYLAFDNHLQRPVAIKVAHSCKFTSTTVANRFLHEARLLAKLQHNGLVRVHDALEIGQAESNGILLVMDYIEGPTLEMRLRDGPIFPTDAAKLLLDVTRAVQYAHENGLVAHRDLKPANILLDKYGKPRVADFGLAVAVVEVGTTQAGGTPAYMAPEQIDGGQALERCDVWALGVILYELLTGVKPFGGASKDELFERIRHTEPDPPSTVRPNQCIDSDLERICQRCLHKTPEQRYATAEELADDLEEWLEQHRKKHQVVLTKDFNRLRRALGKDHNAKVRKAADEARDEGQIRTLSRMVNNTSGPPNIEVYDLGEGFVLVVQLHDEASQTRGFLYCGPFNDAEQWLDTHKEYQWVYAFTD